MIRGNLGGLFGVASQTPRQPRNPRPVSSFDADRTSDANFAAAIQREIDDLRAIDELQEIDPAEMAPGNGAK